MRVVAQVVPIRPTMGRQPGGCLLGEAGGFEGLRLVVVVAALHDLAPIARGVSPIGGNARVADWADLPRYLFRDGGIEHTMTQTRANPSYESATGRGHAPERLGLACLAALVSVNVWTGAPLLALWVGSKVQGNFTSLSMGAVAVVVLVLAIAEFALLTVLTWANGRYDELIGRPPVRRRYPWHTSMRS